MAAVKGIHFDTNSPGGFIDGLDPVAIDIKNSKLPTTGLVTGLGASAAYWLLAQCNQIIATSPIVEVGSIGVMVELVDRSKLDAEIGLKRFILTSKNAPDKFHDVGTAEGRKKIIARLTNLENIFIERVADGRGVSKNKVINQFGHGDIVMAEAALKAGMIDEVNNLVSEKPKVNADGEESPINIISNDLEDHPIQDDDHHHDDNNITGKGGQMANLEETLKGDAKLKVEHNKLIKEAEAKGSANVKANIDKAKMFLNNKKYGKAIQDMALKVITGEVEMLALTTAVTAVDSVRENSSTDDAEQETGEIGDTPAEFGSGSQPTGDCKTEVEFQAELKRAKELVQG